VQHTVRMLRTVVRDTDIVAHVDNHLFAILQPGKSVGDELSSRLSRLVVLGQMTDKNHSDSSPVDFRIVASSLKSFVGEWHELDSALRQKLRLSTGWGRRRIRFVVKSNSEKFETLWMRAVAVSAESPTAAKKA
jgi:GGDEF domain-containing protein